MSLKTIEQVTCSLNLGLIYSLDYSYSPSNGISMKLFFVKEDGKYPTMNMLPLRKAQIQIGSANFSLYPVANNIELAAGRRIMSVEFVDDFFLLGHYYVALPNRGCGTNIFTLGTQVDNRTQAQKEASAVSKTAAQIQAFTQYPDYEYSFNDFLTLLKQKFSVTVTAGFNPNITQAFEGSFESVLSDWCHYYNLGFFFENGGIKIFDPTKLSITLPSKPIDALSYNTAEDIRSTYGKTVCNWFQQDGGDYPLAQTSNSAGTLNVRTQTLNPVGTESNLTQNMMDLDQVVAAQYGQNYWFLYNYSKGTTATQCGFTSVTSSQLPAGSSILASVQAVGGATASIALLNQNTFDQNFEAYQKYGQQIAGKWYLSYENSDLSIDKSFTWFSEANATINDFTNVDNKVLSLDFLTPADGGTVNVVPNTAINSFYSGINYVGNRIVYQDTNQVAFVQNPAITALQGTIDQTFANVVKILGSEYMDFSQVTAALGPNNIVALVPTILPSAITDTFKTFSSQYTAFQPRNKAFGIKGISTVDYTTLKASQKEAQTVSVVPANAGPSLVSNTSVLKTLQQGSYTAYYNKYNQCASSSTPDQYFGYAADVRQISSDNQIGVTFKKTAPNTYNIQRDYSFINNLVNNPALPTLAQARTFSTKKVSFSLNYFYQVPTDFLTNGLVGMNVTVGDNGITSSYEFSNEILKVPDNSEEYNRLAQNMKNSWIRTYRPKEVIT